MRYVLYVLTGTVIGMLIGLAVVVLVGIAFGLDYGHLGYFGRLLLGGVWFGCWGGAGYMAGIGAYDRRHPLL